MRRRHPVVPLAIAVTVAALALTGCKSGSSGAASSTAGTSGSTPAPPSAAAPSTAGGADAAEIVSQASKAGSALKSAHINVHSVVAGKTSVISGDVSYDPVKLHLTVDAGSGITLQEVLVGKTMYLKLPASAGLGTKKWASLSLSKLASASGLDLSSTLNNSSPAQTVKLMEKSGDIKVVGDDTVGGVPTKHLAGTVDMSKVYDQLGGSTKKTWKNLVTQAGVKNVTIDLWVNSSEIPIKTVEKYDSSLGTGTTTMLLTKINAPVSISAPPKSQVKSLLG